MNIHNVIKRWFGAFGILFFILKPLIFVALSFAAFVVFLYIMTIITIIEGIEYIFNRWK